MREQILSLQPYGVWKFFYDICKIPHTSHNLEKISEYVIDFAKSNGFDYLKDSAGNIVIKKPASKGMENKKSIILQAHLDMVGQKHSHSSHNFLTDPLTIHIEDGWVKAINTTLGADNGIGVAAILAILDDKNLVHPEIEALFTCDEECGMEGATLLDRDMLKSSIMINTDSEEDDSVFVGCAGGIDFRATSNYINEVCEIQGKAYRIVLKGLNGGHSGVDIHRGRANANKLLFRFLNYTTDAYGIRISEINGGDTRNAIPREAEAIVVVEDKYCDDFSEDVNLFRKLFQQEYLSIENKIEFYAKEVKMPKGVLTIDFQKKFVSAIEATPNGIERMNPNLDDTVETSSNLAIVKCGNGNAMVQILVRSTMPSQKYYKISSLWSLFSLIDAEIEIFGDYPEWQPNLESPILNITKNFYKQTFGEEIKIKVMHAGLECGIISSLYPNLDMVSLGPKMLHPHSPYERVEVSSVMKFWKMLLGILENIPEK